MRCEYSLTLTFSFTTNDDNTFKKTGGTRELSLPTNSVKGRKEGRRVGRERGKEGREGETGGGREGETGAERKKQKTKKDVF